MSQQQIFKDMSESTQAYLEVVLPFLQKRMGAIDVVPVEGNGQNLSDMLDMSAGVDFVYEKAGIVKGLATRAQWIDTTKYKSYDTFSIRLTRKKNKTEYEKRVEALDTPGAVYPHMTIQAYLDKQNNLLSVACIQTKDLYDYVKKVGVHTFRVYHNKDDSSDFIAVNWSDLGKKVHVYYPQPKKGAA